MSRVSVTINGRQFRMACEDGQEGYLMNLAREIDNRIDFLRSKSGGISDTGLMVMMAITLADELAEAWQRIKRLEEVADRNKTAQTGIAAALSNATERVENVNKVLNQMLASSRRSAESGQHRKLEKVRERVGGVQLDLPLAQR
jgi:cell division protein ZapA